MIIRPYTHGDREAVFEILALNTPTYFAPEEHDDFARYLDRHARHIWVAEKHPTGRVIACGGSDDGESGVLGWGMVRPEEQGKGVGRALTAHRIAALRQLGAKRIGVRTSQLACVFYEKMGFVLRETQSNYWAPGFDLYSMELAEERK